MATTSNTITATAGQTEFSFSFPYLKKESIKVTIDTVATTAFTIPDNNPTTVVLNSGATAGQVLVISRLTSTTATPSTFFSGGAIRSQDLNDNFDSILYITQEKENQLTEVIAGNIADGSITSSKLADQSVGTAALINGGVATVDLADNAVTTPKIINDAVTTPKIINDAVTTPKIINDAVTTDKIVNNAVTTDKIVNDAVTTDKIINDAVTTDKIVNAAVTTDKIADSSVNTDKLAATVILLPTGAITAFGGSTAPTGYLECNGQSTAGYAALAAIVGANVPDLRGEFIRGLDSGRGVDSGRTLGSNQGSANLSHNHGVTDAGHFHQYRKPNTRTGEGSGGTSFSDNSQPFTNTSTETTGITIDNDGGTESRPRNVALMYIIKT